MKDVPEHHNNPQYRGLSSRAKNALHSNGIKTKADARWAFKNGMKLRNVGKKCTDEITQWASPTLPCPFCGQLPTFRLIRASGTEMEKDVWSLCCPGRPLKCTGHPMSFGDTKPEALKAWNQRHPN